MISKVLTNNVVRGHLFIAMGTRAGWYWRCYEDFVESF